MKLTYIVAFAMLASPFAAYAQTSVPTYTEASTGAVKQGIGVTVLAGGGGGGGGAVTGTVVNGGAVSADAPVLTAGYDGANVRTIKTDANGIVSTSLFTASGTAITTALGNADSVAATAGATRLGVNAQVYLFNGTNTDRVRSVIAGADTTGTGVVATGNMAQIDEVSTTTVTENQFGNLRMTPNRAMLVKPYAGDSETWLYAAASGGITNTTTAVTMKTAAGAGLRNYITSCQIDAATLGAATEVAIRDGAAGTVLFRVFSPTAGMSRNALFEVPLRGSANTLLEVVTLTATVTGGVYVNCQGYAAP